MLNLTVNATTRAQSYRVGEAACRDLDVFLPKSMLIPMHPEAVVAGENAREFGFA
ncbi:hypothetical protein SDC9_172684 [bioreactor metagenome]|uniref:Uncharacterized protein n=1 Tax=bioreactor metagenome TaxID=1076179 RepID=A0A645GED3_9ZZZZ